MTAEFQTQEFNMKNKFKLFGTQSLLFCAITLTALFAFALLACDNNTTTSGKPALTGTVSITGGSGENNAVMVGDSLGVDTDSLGGSGIISYQWQSSDSETGNYKNINGKTSEAFEADNQWANKWIKVVVSRADNTGSVSSIAVKVNVGANDLKGTVTIPQKIQVGKYPEMEIELEDDEINSWDCNFQWQKCATANGVYVNIDDEDASYSFYQVNVEPGTYIRVVVTHDDYTGNIKSNACLVEVAGDKEITGFEIASSYPQTVYKGLSYSFLADIEGENLGYDDYGVTWEVSGNNSNNTSFSNNILSVASDESATKLTIKATSDFDDNWSDTVDVDVTDFNAKSITITGLSGMSGSVNVKILSSLDPDDWGAIVCSGTGEIDNGQVTVPLGSGGGYPPDPWDDEGEFYINLDYTLPFGFETYVYTAGEPLNTTDWDENATYVFETGVDVTIDFDQFVQIPFGEGGYELTISGLSELNGAFAYLEVLEASEYGADQVAMGYAVITGGSVTITLADYWDTSTGWTEDGECYLKLTIYSDEYTSNVYVYTNGKSLSELSIEDWNDYWDNAPKFEFTSGNTFSVSFDKFVSGDDIDYSFGW
jgi:hypothetical protein